MYLFNRARYHRARRQMIAIRNSVILVFFLLLTLPFHYVMGHFQIIPKNQWGFNNTFITAADIDRAMMSYSNADKIGKDELLGQAWVQQVIYERDYTVNGH